MVGVGIENSGVVANDAGAVARNVGTLAEFSEGNYPDFIRRLTDSTHLLRSTVIEILSKACRLKDFYNNPEEFIRRVSKLITKAKQENIVDGIQYSRTDEFYSQEEIFDDTELYGIIGSNVVDVSTTKNPLDHVIFDSAIERAFANDCEKDPEVVLYAKLPAKFTVDTPFGTYNPDWMVVLKQEEAEDYKMYFVAETKGNEDIDSLRPDEKNKILCGKKHFEILNNDLKYNVVKTLRKLKEDACS